MSDCAPRNTAGNIDLYEDMLALAGPMLAAARSADRGTLGTLREQCRAVAERARPTDGAVPLERSVKERKIDLIKRLLAADAEISSHTEPWRKGIDPMLAARRYA